MRSGVLDIYSVRCHLGNLKAEVPILRSRYKLFDSDAKLFVRAFDFFAKRTDVRVPFEPLRKLY